MEKRIDDDYMNDNLWNSVCQVILLQEVEPLFFLKMKQSHQRDAPSKVDGAPADQKPMFVGIRGDEGNRGDSLLIAGRPGIVLGIRLSVFHRTVDAVYKER